MASNQGQQAVKKKRKKRVRDPHNLVGKQIDNRFEVTGVIGLGGMGVVYKGRQSAVDRIVAIKVLMPEMVDDESLIKRFHLEARAASRLTHPNSITIHDFGREGNLLYIVMEFLDGQSLQQLLRREKILTPERAAEIGIQCCNSLAEAHTKGIVHRDIKPDNIFLQKVRNNRDFVKVLDFGVAKLKDPSINDVTVTQAGMIFGTPKYMSPEQAKAKKLDGRSDLYALGVVLYECLMGKPPFLADDPVSILIQHVHDPPISFSEKRPDLEIPPDLERITMRALSKKRQDRFPNADMFREALETFVEAQKTQSLAPAQAPPQTAPPGPLAGPAPGPLPPHQYSSTPGSGAHPLPPSGNYAAAPGQYGAPAPGPYGVPGSPPYGVPGQNVPGYGQASPPYGVQSHGPGPTPHGMPGHSTPGGGMNPHPQGQRIDTRHTWSGDASQLDLGGRMGTRVIHVGPSDNRALITVVLILGLVLLGGVGFLVYRMSKNNSAVAGIETQDSTAPNQTDITQPNNGQVNNPAINNQQANNQQANNQQANNQQANNQQANNQQGNNAPVNNQQVNNPPINNQQVNNGQVDNGQVDNGQVDNQTNNQATVQQTAMARLSFSTRPRRVSLDFGDRNVQRDGDVYIVDLADGATVEVRARADGYRSRSYEFEVAIPLSPEAVQEFEIRLHRSRPERTDPCISPVTGLRDPYCNQ